MARKKLYLIGIDSAPLWIIRDFRRKYSLEGFEEFIDKGVLMDMESTMPPMTGPSWPSIYTGYRPGEHGVPEFLKLEPNYTKSVVYYDPSIKPPFWDRLSRRGLRSLVVTPAMLVRPSEEPNVDMITGFPLPARFSSRAVQTIAEKHSYSGEPEIEGKMKSGEYSLKKSASEYLGGIEGRCAVSKELIRKNDYDMMFICFTEQDRMQHFSMNRPEWKDYVMPLYEGISGFLAWIEERARREGATVMVVSDHGAQPIKWKFLLNGWLINRGYATLQRSIEKGMARAGPAGSLKYSIREKVLSSVHKSGSRKVIYDKLPVQLKGVAKSALSAMLSGTSAGDYTRIHDFDYDMRRTVAFSSIANCPVATIYINDGRFDKGVVKAGEKRALKRRIMTELLGVKDGRGRRIIINTSDADGYYGGTKLFIAPDIFAEVREGYILDAFGYLKSGGLLMPPETAKSGDHQRNGIFGAVSYGAALDRRGIARKKLYVYNVEPTVMRHFGLAPGNDRRYGAASGE